MIYLIVRTAAIFLIGTAALGAVPSSAKAQSKPALVRNVDEGALQPIQFSLLPHSSTSSQNAVYYQVPAGQRLVIEYYSAQAQDLSGGAAAMTLSTVSNGNNASYIVYVNKNDTNAVNQTTKIYADPGSFVQAFAFNNGTTCAGLITVSGYLVNIP